MHKLRTFILSSICILSLINCSDNKKVPISGIYANDNEQFVIIENNKLLYPFEAKIKFENDDVILNNEKYKKLLINDNIPDFDSLEVSYNTDNYEHKGIKEFDAKIFSSSIIFYDVENNTIKKIVLDKEFKKWFNFSLQERKMDAKNINKTNNFIICLIEYKNKDTKIIYANAFNDKNDLRLFMTLLVTYLSKNREKGTTIEKMNFKSLDSLENYIDKTNVGLKRVPLPPKPIANESGK